MPQNFANEKWKPVQFNFEYTNDFRLEVSNCGRLRTFTKVAQGNVLKGSMTEGYKIVRLRFFTKREEAMQKKLDNMQKQIFKQAKHIKLMKENKESKIAIKEAEKLLAANKKKLSKKYKDETKKRTIYYHALFHKLVAAYFLPKPTAKQTIVGHLNFDKLNNRATNLKWMTPEENYAHQQKSPYVIEEKKERKLRRKEDSKATKLTVTKVMLLKKLLNQGRPVNKLAKQFKVSDMQIIRIRRGENWSDIPAAV